MSRGAAARVVAAATCALAGVTGPPGLPSAGAAATAPCSQGLVALTFDDGPAAAVTGRLLDVLSARQVPATFFVLGSRVDATPKLARRAYRHGFAVAGHTYRHELLTGLSDADIRGTVRATAKAMRRAGVRPLPLVRPPYGAVDARVRSVLAGMGLTSVLWDVDPRDWSDGSAATIRSRVLGALRPGGRNIVLLHDGVARSGVTLHAVPGIVRGARERGYCFAELDPAGVPVQPVRRVSVSDAAVTEPEPGSTAALTFTLRLDRPTPRRVSVRVRTDDRTAHAGEDYRAVDQRVEFPVGATRQQVTVLVESDRIDEPAERLRLLLGATEGLRVSDEVGVGTIRDDDPPPRVRLADTTVTEPAKGSVEASVPVTLDRPSARRVVLVLTTVPVQADQSDYVPIEMTRVVEPGHLATQVPVQVLADALDEPAETFEVRVVSATHASVADGTATVTIAPTAPASG